MGVKSSEESLKHRQIGNDLLKKVVKSDNSLVSLQNVLQEYHMALLFAPPDSKEFALALSNRSACFFRLKDFQACMKDIEDALNHSHTKSDSKLVMKLNARKSEASLFHLIEEHKLKFTPSSICPNLSEKVKVQNTLDKGRGLMAQQPIKAGEIVIVEKALSCVLSPQFRETSCHFCCRDLGNYSLCCDVCTEEVFYCSKICKTRADREFHWVECGQVAKLSDLGITHLALLIFLKIPKDQLQFWSNSIVKGGDKNSDDYSSINAILYLKSHHCEVLHQDAIAYEKSASGLVELLLRKGYFNEIASQELDANKLYATAIIVGIIERLICNAHSIGCDREESIDYQPMTIKELMVASALFPTASHMNHSCKPNIFSSFINGNFLVVRAVKNMEIGEELLTCYGPMFGRLKREERKTSLLQQYFFECKCVACTDVTFVNKEMAWNAYSCTKCFDMSLPTKSQAKTGKISVRCQNHDCKHEFEAKYMSEIYEGLENGDFDLREFENSVADGQKYLYKYNKSLMDRQDGLSYCYSQMGRNEECVNLVYASLDSIKFWYGNESIEYARELTKLISVIQKCPKHKLYKKLDELNSTRHKIYTIFYGKRGPDL